MLSSGGRFVRACRVCVCVCVCVCACARARVCVCERETDRQRLNRHCMYCWYVKLPKLSCSKCQYRLTDLKVARSINGKYVEISHHHHKGRSGNNDSDSGNDSGIVAHEKKLLSPYATVTKPRTPSHSSSGHGRYVHFRHPLHSHVHRREKAASAVIQYRRRELCL